MKLKLTFLSLLAAFCMAGEARAAESLTLMVKPNGELVGPTNFFGANADLINAVVIGGPSGGEANAGVNLGTNAAVYAGKSGLNLQFRSIRGTGYATTSTNATNVVVDVTIPTADAATLGLLSAADFTQFNNATVNLTVVSNLLNVVVSGLHAQSNGLVLQSNTLVLTINGLNVLSNGWLNTSNYVAALMAGLPVLSNQFVMTSNTVVTLNAGLSTLSNGVNVLSNGVVTLSNQVVNVTLHTQSVSNNLVTVSNAVVLLQGNLNTFSNAVAAVTNALGTAAFQPSSAFAAASHAHSAADITTGQLNAARLPNDIIVFNRVFFGSTGGVSFTASNGSPEGQIIARIGSWYANTNAGASGTNSAIFFKVGGDNLPTGWTNFMAGDINAGAGGGVTVVSGFANPGDGAIMTTGNVVKLLTAYDTNVLKVVLTGDSWMVGAGAWPAKIFGPTPLVPGWNTPLLYTNFALGGTSLNTNEYTNAHGVRPTGNQIGILITCFGMNSDGQTADVTEANQYAYYDMARADGYYVFDQTVPVKTNASAAEQLKVYRLNQSKRNALATGRIHGLNDVERSMGHLMLDLRYFYDGVHPTTLGHEMIAYAWDAILRDGIRKGSHPNGVSWRPVAVGPGTNVYKMVLPNYYTGQPVVEVDGTNGNFNVAGRLIATNGVQGSFGFAVGDETTVITTGTGKRTVHLPRGMIVTDVFASLTTVSSSGPVTVDIKDGGVSIFSTPITIDVGEETTDTAAPSVLIKTNFARGAKITADITAAGANATGLKIFFNGFPLSQ